ncbi:hypothetical protein FXO37_22269 [Capsicum annuum]|nr:hypothetical protein FXO37_22269 [Capsicum annuum]
MLEAIEKSKGCTDLHPDKTNVEIDSQNLIPDELLQSINLDHNLSEKIVHHDVLIIDEKMDGIKFSDSQFTIPDELLPSINAYRRKNNMTRQSTTREEEPSDEHFNDKKSESVVQHYCPKNRKTNADHYKRGKPSIPMMHFGVETVEDKNWFYTMGFPDQSWTNSCDFYIKKGIQVENHLRYKNKDSSDMFDVLFQENFPQQPSESLDCGVYMVTYAECLSYGHKVLANEFDPNALEIKSVLKFRNEYFMQFA